MLASLLVALFAISHDSLWIDEASSAHYAFAPGFAAWRQMMAAGGGSDVQMPLYMFYLWVWEKLCGSSEWILRAANIPWFLLAQGSLWVGLRRWPRFQIAAAFCGACDPFLWRYLDEVRPYAMQYAGAAMLVSCLAWLAASDAPVLRASGVWAFGAGLLILCGSTALGILWAGAAVLALFCLTWRRARIAWSPAFAAASLAFVLALGTLAVYYVWTVEHGAGGSGGFGHPLGSLCFAAYEILGFSGLGPSRIAVTEQANTRMFLPYLGVLLPLAVFLAGTLFFAARAFFRAADSRIILAAGIYAVLPLLAVAGLVFLKGFHAVGRHFTPIAPVIVLAVALAIADATREKSSCQSRWTAAFILLWLVSCLEIRFAPRHRRDDYRDAAHLGRAALAGGKRVWWIASVDAANYYRLPVSPHPKDGSLALSLWRPAPEDLVKLPPPDVVIFSKPAIFDLTGTVTSYLNTHNYRKAEVLPAFSIWEK